MYFLDTSPTDRHFDKLEYVRKTVVFADLQASKLPLILRKSEVLPLHHILSFFSSFDSRIQIHFYHVYKIAAT